MSNDHQQDVEGASARKSGLDAFQDEVARTALAAAAEYGFALAGAGALLAHGLVQRPTQDVDLFSPQPGSPGRAVLAVTAALERAGFEVTADQPPSDVQADFVRLTAARGDEICTIDLARDWRQHPPVDLDVGPVLDLDDAVASKVAAMLGRGLPRDFIDVAAALGRYSRHQLLVLTYLRDPGLRPEDAGFAASAFDRLHPEDFTGYGLNDQEFAVLQQRFSDWPRHGAPDPEAVTAHTAAQRNTDGYPTPPE